MQKLTQKDSCLNCCLLQLFFPRHSLSPAMSSLNQKIRLILPYRYQAYRCDIRLLDKVNPQYTGSFICNFN
jgi:hypothetical protein